MSFHHRLPLRRPLATFVAALCLALPGAGMAAGAAPVALNADFQPAAQAAELVSFSGPQGLKPLQKVAISSFQVEFLTKAAASASSREIGRSGSAGVSTVISLTGVGDADFQAITDALYRDTVAELQALGLEVLPVSRVLASPAYQKMATAGGPSPYRKSGSVSSSVYAPDGLAVYGFGVAPVRGGGLLDALSGLGAAASAIGGSIDLQKELDATLVDVRLVVGFAELQSSDRSLLERISGKAEVKAQVGPTVLAEDSRLSLQGPGGVSTFALQKPLALDGAAIAQVKDTSSVAGNIGLAVLSLAIGNGGSQRAVEKEAQADPAAFGRIVGQGLGAVRQMLLQRLKEQRAR